MIPTIGRIVIYKVHPNEDAHWLTNGATELPAVIVSVLSDVGVNLKVLNDGVQDYWKTFVLLGDMPGQWQWPSRV